MYTLFNNLNGTYLHFKMLLSGCTWPLQVIGNVWYYIYSCCIEITLKSLGRSVAHDLGDIIVEMGFTDCCATYTQFDQHMCLDWLADYYYEIKA